MMGIYHLDLRGAERRWLPPTLPNCENQSLLENTVLLNVSHVTQPDASFLPPAPHPHLSIFSPEQHLLLTAMLTSGRFKA